MDLVALKTFRYEETIREALIAQSRRKNKQISVVVTMLSSGLSFCLDYQPSNHLVKKMRKVVCEEVKWSLLRTSKAK